MEELEKKTLVFKYYFKVFCISLKLDKNLKNSYKMFNLWVEHHHDLIRRNKVINTTSSCQISKNK